MKGNMSKKTAVIKGDGVGPELVNSMLRVATAAGTKVEFILCEGGEQWWKENGGDSLIPQTTWDILGSTDAGFKGPTTTPGGAGSPRSVAVSIRQKFNLYANVRPIKSFPNTQKPLGDVDFVCVREGTEGLYFGKEVQLTDDVYIAIRKITRPACRNVARYAFEEAARRGGKKGGGIDKRNTHKK